MSISKTFFSFLFAFALFGVSLQVAVSDNQFFYTLFESEGAYQQFGEKTTNALHEKTKEYIAGQSSTLVTSLYSQREKDHLKDVRHIVITIVLLSYLSIILLLAAAFKASQETIRKVISNGCLGLLIVLTILSCAIVIDFSKAFFLFHELFFETGTYVFAPNDTLVTVYPSEVFYRTALYMAKMMLGLSLLFLIMCYISYQRKLYKIPPMEQSYD